MPPTTTAAIPARHPGQRAPDGVVARARRLPHFSQKSASANIIEKQAGQLIVASRARQYWHLGAPDAVAAPHCGQRSERESMDGLQS